MRFTLWMSGWKLTSGLAGALMLSVIGPNVAWSHTGGAMLSDFGCARHLSEGTAQGMPPCDDLMDVRYISPEQTGRLQNIVDQRADIYSLGIILLRLLAGKVPFDDADPLHIIDGHVARQPVFPAHLPPGLAKVVLKALAKGPTPVT